MSASEAIANGLIIATTVSFLCVVLLSLCLVLSGRDSAFSPLLILLLINLYSNVARLNLIAVDPQLMQIKYYMATLSTEMLNDGAILVGLGTLSICAGYLFMIFRPTRFNKPKKMPTFNKFRAYLFFGAFLGVLIVLVLSSDSSQTLSAKRLTVGKDGTRYSFGPLRFTLQIMLGALQVIFVYILLNIKNRRLELGIILGLMFLTALLISKRSIIFFSLIPVIMISMHQVNAKKIFTASILGSLVIIAVFRITQLRSEAALGNAFYTSSLYETVESLFVFTTISANFGGIVPTAISSILIEENVDWLVGRTWVIDPVAQFVPRSLWPSKPEELGGQIRIIHQDMGLVSRRIYGGVPPGLFAEAWLNFRLWGVIGFSLIYGAWFGFLYQLTRKLYRIDLFQFGLAIYFAINTTFFLYGGHVARAVNFSVQLLLGFMLLRATGVFRYRRL